MVRYCPRVKIIDETKCSWQGDSNVSWLLSSLQVNFWEEGALGFLTFTSVQSIITHVLGYLEKHFGRCLLTSCLDGHLMSTCLNMWYNMVIQVVKIFETDGWETQKISAIYLWSKPNRRRTNTIKNSANKGSCLLRPGLPFAVFSFRNNKQRNMHLLFAILLLFYCYQSTTQCYTNIQPRLENRHLSGVNVIFYFVKYTLTVTLTLLTDVLWKTDRMGFTGGKETGNITGFFHENFTDQ